MGSHLRFLALVLVVCLCVQHVQIKRIEDQQRAEWQRLRIEMDARKAQAAAPLVGAAAALCNPYVLAALVLGTGAAWCWTHGGKEAFILTNEALLNGTKITKEWVQKRIAELHGYNTDDVSPNDLDISDGQIFVDGKYYSVMSCQSFGYAISGTTSSSFFANNGPYYTMCGVYSSAIYIYEYTDAYGYRHFHGFGVGSSTGSAPSGFNPDDHPELYSPFSNLLSNCHAVAKAHPGLVPMYTTSATRPSTGAAGVEVAPPVYLVAVRPDGSAVDSTGRIWPPIAGATEILSPPSLDENSSGVVVVQGQDTAVSTDTAAALSGAGISGNITGVDGDFVNWTDASGNRHVTRVDSSTAAALGGVTTNSTTISPTADEVDPGDPNDPDFGAPPVFDTNFDWGQNETYDINAQVSVIENLPIVNLVKGSALNLVNADSVISIHLASWPGGPVDLSVDFDQWASIWTVMGAMIYFIALLNSISLAILGHKI